MAADLTPWPSVLIENWDLSAADFPAALTLGGHRYRLVRRVLPVRLNTDAFVQRVIGVVQSGEFRPVLVFLWAPYRASEPEVGGFDVFDASALPTADPAEMTRHGGAIYARVQQ